MAIAAAFAPEIAGLAESAAPMVAQAVLGQAANGASQGPNIGTLMQI